MNSRDRVMAAINQREPDRVPIDLGGTAASRINVNAYVKLKDLLGLQTKNVQIFDSFGMMPRVIPLRAGGIPPSRPASRLSPPQPIIPPLDAMTPALYSLS